MEIIEIKGTRYGRLVAKDDGFKKNNKTYVNCICDCGNEKAIRKDALRSGAIQSCGCLHSEVIKNTHTKHGMHKRKEYRIWSGIKARCNNPKDTTYHNYGGRGINVCKRWADSFDNFYMDMGDIPSDNHSIDRIDVNGDYTPENCRWATRYQQDINKRINSKNKTGITGVSWHKTGRKWQGFINSPENKRIYLGLFDDFFEACCVRKSAENSYAI